MKQMTANDAKSRFGELLDNAIREPVLIKRYGREVAVVLAAEEYASLEQARLDNLLQALDAGAADVAAGRTIALNSREELHGFFEQLLDESRAESVA